MPKRANHEDYFGHITRPGGFADRPQDRNEGSRALEELSTKHRMILSLEMQGHTKDQIAVQLGMHAASVGVITRSDSYIKRREEYLAELDSDFFSMKPMALQALRNGLSDNDPNVALRAADMWFSGARYQGYDKNASVGPTNVTAEDVVKQLLQVNVQVNIDRDR